jgi:hypothetical protein
MKKISIYCFLLILSALYSCTKKNSQEETLTPTSAFRTENDVNWGDIHNEAMDALYNDLKNKFESGQINGSTSAQNIRQTLNNSTNAYLSERCNNSVILTQATWFQIINNGDAYVIAGDTVLADQLFDHVLTKWGHKLTPSALNLLTQINVISSDESMSLEQTLEALQNVLNQVDSPTINGANTTLTEREKGFIKQVISIAKGSFQYWHTNYPKWQALFDKHKNLRGCPVNWKKAGKSDVAGAAGGGVAGAIVGGSVSFGVLTVPGWAVGAISAGVGSSVTSVVENLLDCIW